MYEMFWESDGNRQLVEKAVAIRGPGLPSKDALDATVAELRRRVDLKDRLLHVHPRTVDMMLHNAAALVHWLRAKGRSKAELKADLDAYVAPAVRGVLVYVEHNADGSNNSVYGPMEDHLSSLLDAIVDLADPAWEPA